MALTSLQITQLNNMNAASQRAGLGTILSHGEPAGTVFYVDQNAGNDSNNNGLSWGSPFKTLSVALAASAANIAASSFGWSSRNVIYAKADPAAGDTFIENLVLLAPKTDVVGVGSWDRYPFCGLRGNHVPTGATASYGTRFFNFKFMGPIATGGDIWTLDAYSAWLEFNNCLFSAQSTTAATGAIVTAAASHLRIIDSQFMGKFSDSVIEIGAGDARGTLIKGNHIEGANVGIELAGGATDSSGATEEYIYIQDNTIVSVTESILDSSSLAYITGNRCFSGNNKGTTGFGVIAGALARGQDNRITSADPGYNMVWPAQGSL
jgi:hypothetical protein